MKHSIAYFQNFIHSKEEYKNYKRWMEFRADNLLAELPRNKRDVALEEAYSSFIGMLISSRRSPSKNI